MKKRRSDRQLADDIVALLDSDEDRQRHPDLSVRSLLQKARDAGDGALRVQYLREAQKEIAKLDPGRHARLISQLQGEVLALQGRGSDTQVAHVTPGEVVIPERLQTPELLAALHAAANAQGMDPARLVVGSRRNSINPKTGQAEFHDYNGQEIEEITVPAWSHQEIDDAAAMTAQERNIYNGYRDVARQVLGGQLPDNADGATSFHTGTPSKSTLEAMMHKSTPPVLTTNIGGFNL